MRRLILVALSLLLILGCVHAAPALALEPGQVGVVVLHGKLGSPDRLVAGLASGLRAAGFLVSAPELAWSGNRRFDKDYFSAVAEIDEAVRGLRQRGAVKVVVAGHSLGASAALAYAARHPGLDGLVCIAAGHTPELARQRARLAPEVSRARALVAAGRGQERGRFLDLNMGQELEREEPASIYLSYNDPEGPAVMPKNAAAIGAPLPLLWIVGSRDPLSQGREYAFDLVPMHQQSRFQVVEADHKGAPAASLGLVLEWLRGLWP